MAVGGEAVVEAAVTHDDVNHAFASNSVLDDPDERLLQYLRLLCSTQIRSEENRLLANNRCITVNTILTKRFMDRVNRTTTRYTWAVMLLAVAALGIGIAQLWVEVFH